MSRICNSVKFLLARLFGKRRVGVDGNTKMICYLWRGSYYAKEVNCEPDQ